MNQSKDNDIRNYSQEKIALLKISNIDYAHTHTFILYEFIVEITLLLL